MNGQPSSQVRPVTSDEERVMRTVLAAIRQVRHGHVQILLQDGKVVQIDRLEKERL
jgi:hypothetical protein